MTLTIELTLEEAVKLHRLAQAKGTDEAGAVRELLAAWTIKPLTALELLRLSKEEYAWMTPISPTVGNGLTKDSAADALQIRTVALQRFQSK